MHRDAKINEHWYVGASVVALPHNDIFGLDVEVQHVVIVQALDGAGNRSEDAEHLSLANASTIVLYHFAQVTA